MPPVIAEVVDVLEGRPRRRDGPETGLALASWWRAPAFPIVRAVADPIDLELVKMSVLPAESGLQDVVQAHERRRLRHEQAAPNRRLGAHDGGLELVDAIRHRFLLHTLRTCKSA